MDVRSRAIELAKSPPDVAAPRARPLLAATAGVLLDDAGVGRAIAERAATLQEQGAGLRAEPVEAAGPQGRPVGDAGRAREGRRRKAGFWSKWGELSQQEFWQEVGFDHDRASEARRRPADATRLFTAGVCYGDAAHSLPPQT